MRIGYLIDNICYICYDFVIKKINIFCYLKCIIGKMLGECICREVLVEVVYGCVWYCIRVWKFIK